MLLSILSDYLDLIEQAIQQCSNVYVERYEEEILMQTRANLRIRLRFNQTHFPHHKHLPDDVIASFKPEITQVLQEVIELMR